MLLLAACGFANGDDPYDDSGNPASEPSEIDIVLVMDASDSMVDASFELAQTVSTLFGGLEDADVDWRMAVTTTSVYYDDGETSDIDPGEAGTFVGGAWYDLPADATAAMLCGATCWNEHTLDSDPDYVCGDDPVRPSPEYLDCVCGADVWHGHCGSGVEEGLEASLLTAPVGTPPATPMCRSTSRRSRPWAPRRCPWSARPTRAATRAASMAHRPGA